MATPRILKRLLIDAGYLMILIAFFLIWVRAIKSTSQTLRNERESLQPSIEQTVEIKQVQYLTDTDFSKLYSFRGGDINDTCLSISSEDAWLLMRIARCEGGEDRKAQALIMRVILNRLEDNNFPNTIKEIIYQNGQFSSVSDGNFDKSEPNIESHLALADIESLWDESKGALYFEASWLEDSWQSENRTFLFEYEGTKYYR